MRPTFSTRSFAILTAFAPLVFLAHWWEEAPGFVEWFNAHVARGITQETFSQVNMTALVITVIVSLIAWIDASNGSVIANVAWLSLLMGANAVLHIGGAIIDRAYVPGVATALLLYVPYYALVLLHARRRGIQRAVLIATSLAGAMPMLVHGYLILFRGSRLF